MATLKTFSVFAVRNCAKVSGFRAACQQIRCKSSEHGNDDLFEDNGKPLVGKTSDGSTHVCWHPEPSFPYEFSKNKLTLQEKPVVRKVNELEMGDSNLKVQHLLEEKLKLRPRGPSDQELANMFFTSKHRWHPKPGKKYRRPNLKNDRERL